jgi:hypothetical protein
MYLLVPSRYGTQLAIRYTRLRMALLLNNVVILGSAKKLNNHIKDNIMKTNVFNKLTKNWGVGLFTALTLTVANHAGAQNLPAPVSGTEILDLAGTPVEAGVADYSATFVATSTESYITFVFRHDPGFFTLENVDVTQGGNPPNLIVNGDFSAGAPTTPGGGAPGWSYFIQAGNVYPQFLGNESGPGGEDGMGPGFYDGSTQAYDGIDQMFATVVGDTYDVDFGLEQAGANVADYQQVSNNGDTTDTAGNGVDVVLYAGNALPPTSTPDVSSTFVLLLSSFGLLAFRKLSTLGRAAN